LPTGKEQHQFQLLIENTKSKHSWKVASKANQTKAVSTRRRNKSIQQWRITAEDKEAEEEIKA